MIRVFLLDDHQVVRRGLAALLESYDDIEVVGDSGSAQEAVRLLPALRPDVAVLDARLPDGSGIDVCREVRSASPSIRALMLTSYQDDEALLSAIMAGAAGYLLKQVRGTDLVDAVRTVAAGGNLIDPAVTQRVLRRLREDPGSGELEALTAQERRMLELMAEGMTNVVIGSQLAIPERTVRRDISTLLGKLGLTRRTQAAVLASKLLDD